MKCRVGELIRRVVLGAAFFTVMTAFGDDSGACRAQQQARDSRTPAVVSSLTGTYREKNSQDAEIGRRVLAATARLDEEERVRQARALLRTLRVAPSFAIEQYGTTITMNYPGGVRVPYEADDKPRVMRATGGESITVRAALAAGRLVIDLTWSGGERLRLEFESPPGGDKLIYTRTAGSRFLERPLTISSEYVRTSPRATRTFDRMAATQ